LETVDSGKNNKYYSKDRRMVVRNHLFSDPESTPPRGSQGGFGNQSNNSSGRPAAFSSSFSDDAWYEGSGESSPADKTGGGMASSGAGQSRKEAPPNASSSFFSAFQANNSGFGGGNVMGAGYSADGDNEDYENEPPLLEELGIRFDHIWSKTQAVVNLKKQLSEHILDDTDLAGPVCFCLLLGACLLLSGKVHFGYIYGFSMCGCLSLQGIITLMHPVGLDFWQACSVLGYCLLPVIFLAALGILVSMKSIVGLILAIVAIGWSTLAATRLIDAKLHLTEQYWLVAYPVMLLYSCFVLITIF
jgi:hypothetical protein